MTQLERLYQLNSFLLNEMPQYKKQALSFGKDEKNQTIFGDADLKK